MIMLPNLYRVVCGVVLRLLTVKRHLWQQTFFRAMLSVHRRGGFLGVFSIRTDRMISAEREDMVRYQNLHNNILQTYAMIIWCDIIGVIRFFTSHRRLWLLSAFIGSTCTVGRLCGVCDDGYGVTLDLQACSPSSQCAAGLALFLFLCKIWSNKTSAVQLFYF